uniref:Uncharacterized protein n=1 Tax=viral metagenome TaxID=1070528 RepID=A0A6M3LV92_9ZZZZ
MNKKYTVEYNPGKSNFTRVQWEPIFDGMSTQKFLGTEAEAIEKIHRLSAIYEEPETKYRIVEIN